MQRSAPPLSLHHICDILTQPISWVIQYTLYHFEHLHFNTFQYIRNNYTSNTLKTSHLQILTSLASLSLISDLCLRESSPCRNVAVGIGFERWRRQATNRPGQQPNCPRAYFRRPWNTTQNKHKLHKQRIPTPMHRLYPKQLKPRSFIIKMFSVLDLVDFQHVKSLGLKEKH